MLFNTFEFFGFFVVVYFLYLLFNHKWQNRMLLVASYIFYGSWDWRFLSLILVSTVIDYFCGLKIAGGSDQKRKKVFLFISVFANLALLGFFKYFDFFTSSFSDLMATFGFSVKGNYLNIILPVGISFYTFQTMSYTIDIYKGKLEPTRRFFDFALFVAFFPQLVAGPIERAKNLLPQILSPRKVTLDKFYEGAYLIFWGIFLKVFVADNLARVVGPVFVGPPYEGGQVLLSLYAFAFQIFCDFSGYSNIARGLGKCMGFEIMVNFNLPYFATNPSEFWKRWHISLSTWLKDYLYIPLGGNKKGTLNTYRNLAITMLLGGLWHGAAWTFVLWGAYQGALLIIHRLFASAIEKIPGPKNKIASLIWFIIRVAFFFQLVCIGWLIFRAQSVNQVLDMLHAVFFNFNIVRGIGLKSAFLVPLVSYLWLLLLIQAFSYWKRDLHILFRAPLWAKAIVYVIMYFCLVSFGATGGHEFIYFQF